MSPVRRCVGCRYTRHPTSHALLSTPPFCDLNRCPRRSRLRMCPPTSLSSPAPVFSPPLSPRALHPPLVDCSHRPSAETPATIAPCRRMWRAKPRHAFTAYPQKNAAPSHAASIAASPATQQHLLSHALPCTPGSHACSLPVSRSLHPASSIAPADASATIAHLAGARDVQSRAAEAAARAAIGVPGGRAVARQQRRLRPRGSGGSGG
eukprot:366338-Chlamydomonas_euryale.AAC.5